MSARGWRFERPRCPYCRSGWLRRNSRHDSYTCLTCDTAFSQRHALYEGPQKKPRSESGSGQFAGPRYYRVQLRGWR